MKKKNIFLNSFFLPTDISIADLSRGQNFRVPFNHDRPILGICVNGGELSLSRLWSSVKVQLEFHKTDVHSYEAERSVNFFVVF